MNTIKYDLLRVFDINRAYAVLFSKYGQDLGYAADVYLKKSGIGLGGLPPCERILIANDAKGAFNEVLINIFETTLEEAAETEKQLTFDHSVDYHQEITDLIVRYGLIDPLSSLALLSDERHFPFPMSDGHTVMFMTQAYAQANRSYAKDLKVGAVLVEALPNNLHRIISDGYNGTEPKAPNECEDESGESLPDVIHAERNLFRKLMRSNESGVGSILFVTRSPCTLCVELVIDAGVAHVVYCEEHVNPEPMLRLMKMGIKFSKVPKDLIISNVESIAQRLKQPKFNECPDCGK
ncbi:MAG: hypothetical protein GY833_22410 [Aestuariibacter sp.]|nr:hypothetical protein [Aestuariibacter sp.]|tara:strand:+ start:270528 stop:271409 length:882 start_codon:yes stop_codon:yes gene_type:complete